MKEVFEWVKIILFLVVFFGMIIVGIVFSLAQPIAYLKYIFS